MALRRVGLLKHRSDVVAKARLNSSLAVKDLRTLVLWAGVTGVSSTIGWLPFPGVGDLMLVSRTDSNLFVLFPLAVGFASLATLVGALAGTLQSILFSDEHRIGVWVFWSAVGTGVGWLLAAILMSIVQHLLGVPSPYDELTRGNPQVGVLIYMTGGIVGSVVGLIVGLAQVLVLRRQLSRAVVGWVSAWVLTWGVGGILYWSIYRATGGSFTLPSSYFQPEPWPGWPVYYGSMLLACITSSTVVGLLMSLALLLLTRGGIRTDTAIPKVISDTTTRK